ncbi:MAG: GNAT family N-acetyltransferase [Sphaerochaetaceae bacterium]|jgi:predicted acetyltransferase
MIDISLARTEDIPQLKELWNIVFEEEQTYLESFFSQRIYINDIFVAKEGDTVVSALHALPSTYTQQYTTSPCSYIVGAATYKEYRKQGIMGELLQSVSNHYTHPITLFPAVREYYEKHGYFTTNEVYEYPLNTPKHTIPTSKENRVLDYSQMNQIYQKATHEGGALNRDLIAWKFLSSGYQTLLIKDAYAFISHNKAVEAMAVDKHSAQNLLKELTLRGISHIHVVPHSPLLTFLGDKEGSVIPMGMATDPSLQDLYIAEQY